MKRFVVVGLGHFGSWVARALTVQGHDVIAIESREGLVDRYGHEVTRAVAGDATDRDLLREIGADKADIAVISTGENLATSILATIALRDLGVKEVYVKVGSVDAARALEALNVTETIFPEREVAHRLARRIVSRSVLDYIPLGSGMSIQELAIPDAWIGRSLRDLALPAAHGIQVVAIHSVLTGDIDVVPDPDRPLTESDIAIVAGPDAVIAELVTSKGAEA